MGTRFAAILAVMMVAGCGGYGAEAFTCDNAAQCPTGGACQPNGSCSQLDPSCTESGQRYTDHSGSLSGTCVGQQTGSGSDASIDVPIDAQLCFGNAPFAICLAAAPTAPLPISSTMTINTDTSSMCVATTSGGANYCVVAATSIAITAKLRGVGSKPLVLIAADSITVSTTSGQIDVASHRGDPDRGAGANPTVCVAGTPPGTRAGGAGGSFTGKGGKGGNAAGGGTGGQAADGTTSITTLRGGCAGQDGDGGGKGVGGRGGGAVYLIAGNRIDIGGSGIDAAGEGGSQGTPNAGASSGAGGGGAGGMIGFDALTITCNTLILANGGGGGEGSGEATPGGTGSDPSETDPAPGGSGNQIGGNGGPGSSGTAAGPGGDASNGSSAGGSDGGGGGGGGAAGLIRVPVGATLGTLVSPPATP